MTTASQPPSWLTPARCSLFSAAAAWAGGRKPTATRHHRKRTVGAVRPASRIAYRRGDQEPSPSPECNAHGTAVLGGHLIVGTVIGDAPEWSLWTVGSAVWFAAAS